MQGADHRSRGSMLKVTSIRPEERPGAAQQECIGPEDLGLDSVSEGDWRWEDCDKVISSVACPTPGCCSSGLYSHFICSTGLREEVERVKRVSARNAPCTALLWKYHLLGTEKVLKATKANP